METLLVVMISVVCVVYLVKTVATWVSDCMEYERRQKQQWEDHLEFLKREAERYKERLSKLEEEEKY